MTNKLKIKVHESADTGSLDIFKRLAETVSKIMKSGKINLYYDSEPDFPAEIYVGREGYGIAIYSDGKLDPSIDEWLNGMSQESVEILAEITYIGLGNPYRRADDDEAGKTIPTYEEWSTTLKVFSPNYYDPTIDVYCREFSSVAEIEQFIKEHS